MGVGDTVGNHQLVQLWPLSIINRVMKLSVYRRCRHTVIVCFPFIPSEFYPIMGNVIGESNCHVKGSTSYYDVIDIVFAARPHCLATNAKLMTS